MCKNPPYAPIPESSISFPRTSPIPADTSEPFSSFAIHPTTMFASSTCCSAMSALTRRTVENDAFSVRRIGSTVVKDTSTTPKAEDWLNAGVSGRSMSPPWLPSYETERVIWPSASIGPRVVRLEIENTAMPDSFVVSTSVKLSFSPRMFNVKSAPTTPEPFSCK